MRKNGHMVTAVTVTTKLGNKAEVFSHLKVCGVAMKNTTGVLKNKQGVLRNKHRLLLETHALIA